MEEIIPQTARFIGRLILDLCWYFSRYFIARIILPLVSLGYLQVQPLTARDLAEWWWQQPFRRLPSGRVEVSVPMATAIGFVIWGIVLLCVVLRYANG